MAENKRPVKEIRDGSVKLAIWCNETETGNRYSVTVSRLYKDGDQWKTTSGLNATDLPHLAFAAARANIWIQSTLEHERRDIPA